MSSNENFPPKNQGHANLHVGSFLGLPYPDENDATLQILEDGKKLTAENLFCSNNDITLSRPILVKDTPESIGMTVLKVPKRDVAVKDIAEILGEAFPIHVIDVEYQEELEGWTLGDLVDYFEDPARLTRKSTLPNETVAKDGTPRKRQRKAAVKALKKKADQRPRVLNQISLEFSQTPLRQKIASPQFVRDMDWIDNVWPGRALGQAATLSGRSIYPSVQYYCLTSAAGSYTDFHVDFGGTSVWYHVLNGQKEFCLIAPTKDNLQAYEDWLCRVDQDTTFLPDLIADPKDILRLSLKASQTMVIPSAWIHAVYTPIDSLVLGGNFLHGVEMDKQLAIYGIETRTKVPERFRFPLFVPLHFYAGGMYLRNLRLGNISPVEVSGCHHLIEALEAWWLVHREEPPTSPLNKVPNVSTAAHEAAQQNECSTVDEFLSALRKEHRRVFQGGAAVLNNNDQKEEKEVWTKPDRPRLKLKLKANNGAKTDENVARPKPTSSLHKLDSVVENPKKIRLKLKGDSEPSETNSMNFRIALSSNTTAVPTTSQVAPKPKSKRIREDTEWYYDDARAVDDEWMPSPPTNKKSKPKANSKKLKKAATNKATKAASKSTARQRLLKRFG